MDIDAMTPREFVAGLMRGNRAEFKLGYTPEAAVLAAVAYKRLDPEEGEELRSYAHGFHDGLAQAVERAQPGEAFAAAVRDEDQIRAYSQGYLDGNQEDGFQVYPDLRERVG